MDRITENLKHAESFKLYFLSEGLMLIRFKFNTVLNIEKDTNSKNYIFTFSNICSIK